MAVIFGEKENENWVQGFTCNRYQRILYLATHSIYLFNVCEFIINSSDSGCMFFWNMDTGIHITSDVWKEGRGIGSWTGRQAASREAQFSRIHYSKIIVNLVE